MAMNSKDVIRQLKNMDLKITPEIEHHIIRHLSDPETKQKIATSAKTLNITDHAAAMTSAVIALSKTNPPLIEDDIATMLHARLSEDMRAMHKAGGAMGRLGRAAAAIIKEKMKRMPLMRRR